MIELKEHLEAILCPDFANAIVKCIKPGDPDDLSGGRASIVIPYLKTDKQGNKPLLRLEFQDGSSIVEENVEALYLFTYSKYVLLYSDNTKKRFIKYVEELKEHIKRTQDIVFYIPDKHAIFIFEGWRSKAFIVKSINTEKKAKNLKAPFLVRLKATMEKNAQGLAYPSIAYELGNSVEIKKECLASLELLKQHFLWRLGETKTSPLYPLSYIQREEDESNASDLQQDDDLSLSDF